MILDVVVPIPLPLSAILILVIGTQPPDVVMRFIGFTISSHCLDLGFELFVAVSPCHRALLYPVHNPSNAAFVRMGPARDERRIDAYESQKAG